jgi:hypothetical protein
MRAKFVWPNAPGVFGCNRVFQQTYIDSQAEIGGNWTIGTLPTILSARQLAQYIPQEYLLSAKLDWTLRTSQPVVMSVCSPTSNHAGNISYSHVNGSTSALHNATELYDALSWVHTTIPYYMSWIQMPQEPTSLLALIKDNSSKGNSGGEHYFITPPRNDFTVCTISPFWWETTTSLSLTSAGKFLVQTDWLPSGKNIAHDKLRPIIINPKDMPMLSTLALLGTAPIGSAFSSETIVKGFVAALASLPGQDASALPNHDAYVDTLEKVSTSMPDSTSYTPFRIDKKVTGYGYGGNDTAVQLSLAVIVAYCLITIVYITYTIATGHTSIAWNSATELIMLALQSKEPSDLGHVSVGVDTIETLCRSVGIRVSTVSIADTGEYTEKLELVFEHDTEHKRRILKKIERNQAY